DGNACTTDTCAAQTGCAHAAVSNGTSCSDGDACNGGEVCQGGVCQPGTPLNCDDGNACTMDACSAQTGCTHAPLTGTSCTDRNACTSGDQCQAGLCMGTPVPNCRVCARNADCDDGNACTQEGCNRVLGICESQAIGGCCNSDGVCNDNRLCTADSCTGS